MLLALLKLCKALTGMGKSTAKHDDLTSILYLIWLLPDINIGLTILFHSTLHCKELWTDIVIVSNSE